MRQLVKAARERGEDLTGPDGLLKQLMKTGLETALDEEMTEHHGNKGTSLVDFIEDYNVNRKHSSLGMRSQIQRERDLREEHGFREAA